MTTNTFFTVFPDSRWEDLHFAGDDLPEDLDISNEMLALHPHEGTLTAWAVVHRMGLTVAFPTPTMQFKHGDQTVSVWYLRVPVRPGQKGYEKAVNKWKMTITALTHELQGEEMATIPNPFFLQERWKWTGTTLMMKDFVDHLRKHNKFTHVTHPDFLKAGGMSTTEAQKVARRANFEKARAEAQKVHEARKVASAEKVMAWVAEGLTNEQLAENLGIALGSVQTTVARARRVLGMNEAEVTPKPAEAVVAPAPAITASEQKAVKTQAPMTMAELEGMLNAPDDKFGDQMAALLK